MQTKTFRIITTALLLLSLASCERSSTPSTSDRASAPTASSAQLAEALRLEDPYARARALGEILPKLDPAALPEVKESLGNFRAEFGPVEFDLLLRYWADQDPEEATNWMLKSCPPLYRITAARTTIELLARRDPQKAIQAVDSTMVDSDEMSRVAQVALVLGWYAKDRDELMKFIRGLAPGMLQQRSFYAYSLARISDEGADAAIRWAESIPDDQKDYKQTAFQQMMAALSWADSPGAVRFCDKHCDGPYASGLREVLIRARLNRGENGAEVVEWVAKAPDLNDEQRAAKSHALWVAYTMWAFRDHDAAESWMAAKLAQPEATREPWLKRLVGEYARQIAADDPARAIQVAEQIEDESERTLSLVRIARYWRTLDEPAAEAWLAKSPLKESDREEARNTQQPMNLPRVKH